MKGAKFGKRLTGIVALVALLTISTTTSAASAATPRSPQWRISGDAAVLGPGQSFHTEKVSVLGGDVWWPPLVEPSLALARTGRLLVAWPGPSGVLAAVGSLHTGLTAPPTQLAPSLSALDTVARVRAAIGPRGTAAVSWNALDRLSPTAAQVNGASAFPSPAGPWQSLPFIEGPSSERCFAPAAPPAPSIAFDNRGDGFAVWVAPVRPGAEGAAEKQQVESSFMSAKTGTWAKPVALSPARTVIYDAQVLVDAGGGAAAVWSGANALPNPNVIVGGCSRTTLEASLHPAGGRWGSPARLGGSREEPPMVAIRPRGEVVVIWREDQAPAQPLSVRTAALSHPRWSAPATLPGSGDGADTREAGLASGRDGASVVWWLKAQGSTAALLAVSSAPGTRWSQPRTIARWRTPPEVSASPETGSLPTCSHVGEAFVGFDRRDRTIAVWQEGCGATFTALGEAHGASWSAARMLEGLPTDVSAAFTIGADGELVAAWLAPGPVTAVGPFPGKQTTTTAHAALFRRVPSQPRR